MRTLIVSEFVTLDGVMEAPGGEPTHPHTRWVIDYEGPEQIEYKLGRGARRRAPAHRTGDLRERFAGAWPSYSGEFADKMNDMPKIVVSSTTYPPRLETTPRAAGRRGPDLFGAAWRALL
jgi:hypothetical protein